MILIRSVIDSNGDRSILVPNGWTIVKQGILRDSDQILNQITFKWINAVKAGLAGRECFACIAIRKNSNDLENCYEDRKDLYQVYTFDNLLHQSENKMSRVSSKSLMRGTSPYMLHFGVPDRRAYWNKELHDC